MGAWVYGNESGVAVNSCLVWWVGGLAKGGVGGRRQQRSIARHPHTQCSLRIDHAYVPKPFLLCPRCTDQPAGAAHHHLHPGLHRPSWGPGCTGPGRGHPGRAGLRAAPTWVHVVPVYAVCRMCIRQLDAITSTWVPCELVLHTCRACRHHSYITSRSMTQRQPGGAGPGRQYACCTHLVAVLTHPRLH